MGRHRYLIALGSNMRHPKYGAPRQVLVAALSALDHGKCRVSRASRIIESDPVGPSRRKYANAVAIIHSRREPELMLARVQKIESRFGRRRRGAAWSARVLDLDIVLWSGGGYAGNALGADLVIPHPAFRKRDFVLGPAGQVARDWRDPLTNLTIGQLNARHRKPKPINQASS